MKGKWLFSYIHQISKTLIILLSLGVLNNVYAETFNFTGAVQTYTVPAGVTSIDITAVGADGGNSHNPTLGGSGATITSTIPVTPGDLLNVIVGGSGVNGVVVGPGAATGGGGGGSGVYNVSTSEVLVAAGGGGGADGGPGPGLGGTATESGADGVNSSGNAGAGGTGGNGGTSATSGISTIAGGGGGVLTAGETGTYPQGGAGGGAGIPSGGAGGAGATNGAGNVAGAGGYGFGGGGGGSTATVPGGGGGYSGGGAGDGELVGGAGGGGSFVIATATSSNIIAGVDGGGTESNGSVIINANLVAPATAVPTLSQWGLLLLILGLIGLMMRRRVT